jgi:hypothetical protein
MAALASIAELRVVDLRVAGDALRSSAWGGRIPAIVTGLALRLGVTSCEAQLWMIHADVGDFRPIGFVVAGRAFGSCESPLVGILVAGDTAGLQTEKRGVSPPVATVVAVFALDRRMSAFERPTRQSMVEPRWTAARPANEPRVSSQMLDVTSTARLVAVLAPVQARLLSDASAQIFVTCKACICIDSLAGRVALTAVRIALEIGVVTAQLSRGKKLGDGLSRPQGSRERRHDHRADQDGQGRAAVSHCEKIHR